MIEIQEMTDSEMEELLAVLRYGHLGCALDGVPYVVPVHYSFDKPHLYIYTTEGRKTEIISANPNICLQIEDVVNDGEWRSVMLTGRAERITAAEREEAIKLILEDNPNLAPAVSVKWRDHWIREDIEVIYRIIPERVSGRRAVHVETHAAVARGRGARIY